MTTCLSFCACWVEALASSTLKISHRIGSGLPGHGKLRIAGMAIHSAENLKSNTFLHAQQYATDLLVRAQLVLFETPRQFQQLSSLCSLGRCA